MQPKETKIVEKKIGNKVFKIKEMDFFDEVEFIDNYGTEGMKLMDIIKLCVVEPEMTEEAMRSLSPKEGNQLLNEINTVNAWLKEGFQGPSKS